VPLGKVVGLDSSLEVLYSFWSLQFFPPRAVTMGRYNVLTKMYLQPILYMKLFTDRQTAFGIIPVDLLD